MVLRDMSIQTCLCIESNLMKGALLIWADKGTVMPMDVTFSVFNRV
jgi:hypothetical protein